MSRSDPPPAAAATASLVAAGGGPDAPAGGGGSGTAGMRWRAVHADATGGGWRGPVRGDEAAAVADADALIRDRGVPETEVMVLAVPPDTDAPAPLPPNPLARRELDTPLTAAALTGVWAGGDGGGPLVLDLRPDGTCRTAYETVEEYYARGDAGGLGEAGSFEVLHDSAFLVTAPNGENTVYAVTAFDGGTIAALVDGFPSQPETLTRTAPPAE